MTPLHRHQIAWLTLAGWQRICAGDSDAVERECLEHWAAHRLPLVVTRQNPHDEGAASIAMGLSAPIRWARRRIALQVPRVDVLHFDEFPSMEQVLHLLPQTARGSWLHLVAALKACGVVAHVYGSLGWQQLTGLDHLHSQSDVDLWVAVSTPAQADAVASLLQAFSCGPLRLDGELMFCDGKAVAWREWQAWRAGGPKSVLVKSLNGSVLSHTLGACRSTGRARAPA